MPPVLSIVIPPPRRPALPAVPPALRLPGLALLTAAAMLGLDAPLARRVLAGGFADPDDAMRLVEVRAWLASSHPFGRDWFDNAAARLDPPAGASMHWSRLVDLPNAALIRLLGPLTPQAENWDRVLLPALLFALFTAGLARLAGLLVGRPAWHPAAFAPAALLYPGLCQKKCGHIQGLTG